MEGMGTQKICTLGTRVMQNIVTKGMPTREVLTLGTKGTPMII
jgi:hypothetical protein